MFIYQCDRCGKILKRPVINGVYSQTPEKMVFTMFLESEEYHLCEQCYTTILEVLKDGDIK